MFLFKVLFSILFLMLIINNATCEDKSEEKVEEDEEYENEDNVYHGEKFPKKYLTAEKYIPSLRDLEIYLIALSKVVANFASEPNNTDVNKALTLFLARGVLRKAMLEDDHKLNAYHKYLLSYILNMSEYCISHYTYSNSRYMREFGVDNEYRISRLIKEDDILVKSLPDFGKNKMKKWILGHGKLNDFVEGMDEGTLPREIYTTLVGESITDYHITIEASDRCLTRVSRNIAPAAGNKTLQACALDPYCKKNIHAAPSIAYSLSHRLLNMLMYRYLRHCYWVSPGSDELHMELLCVFMYREAVFLARKGFFARDMFLEHVSLCGVKGYTEFFRRHWIHKVIQWMDYEGCIRENPNFERNATVARIKTYSLMGKEREKTYKRLKNNLRRRCHTHPMAVLVLFLANAIRHAMHFIK